MSVLGQITDTLGAAIWRNCMVVLTHANAARAVSPMHVTNTCPRDYLLGINIVQQGAETVAMRVAASLLQCSLIIA